MSYRGSLTQCITYLGDSWKHRQIEYLSIICHPHAKYYSVVTDEQLKDPQYEPDTGDVRLVFRGSRREFAVFFNHPQQDIFKELNNATHPTDRTNGQQPDDDSPKGPTDPTLN